jgi:hypothetical protein
MTIATGRRKLGGDAGFSWRAQRRLYTTGDKGQEIFYLNRA